MVPEKEESSDTISAAASLAMVRDIAFVIAIYAYFTGFTYFYFWRLQLGIPIVVADEPVFHIFVYAFQVFRAYWIAIACYIVASIFVWTLKDWIFEKIAWFKIHKRVQSSVSMLLLITVVLFLFKLLYDWSSSAADLYVTEVRAGNEGAEPNIKVMLKPEFKRYFDQTFMYDNEHFCLALVGETGEMVYALSQDLYNGEMTCTSDVAKSGSKLPFGYVYAIPKNEIISVIVQLESDGLKLLSGRL